MDFERDSALLLQRALASLAREASRREREAQWRPEGQVMYEQRMLQHIREWCQK